MKFYFCEGKYFHTKDEAEKAAREAAQKSFHEIVVDRVEVDTTRDNILRMLNVEGGHTATQETVYRTRGRKK